MITPVFALDAEDLFETGQYFDAIALCKQGLELYPEYASGYVVLYRALIALEREAEALNALNSGLEALPANRILLRLLNEHSAKYDTTKVDEPIEFPAIVSFDEPVSSESEELQASDSDTPQEISTEGIEPKTVIIGIDKDIKPDNEEIADILLTTDNISEVISADTQEENTADVISSERLSYPALRIIESASQGEKVLIRASSLGLIPGLQFTPMSLRKPARRFSSELPELPPFREFAQPMIVEAELVETDIKTKTPLEELAARLEKARVAIVQDETPTVQDNTVEIVSTATETVAKIYESQGAYSQAVKVYKQLAQAKPELKEKYEALIERIRNNADVKKTR